MNGRWKRRRGATSSLVKRVSSDLGPVTRLAQTVPAKGNARIDLGQNAGNHFAQLFRGWADIDQACVGHGRNGAGKAFTHAAADWGGKGCLQQLLLNIHPILHQREVCPRQDGRRAFGSFGLGHLCLHRLRWGNYLHTANIK